MMTQAEWMLLVLAIVGGLLISVFVIMLVTLDRRPGHRPSELLPDRCAGCGNLYPCEHAGQKTTVREFVKGIRF